MNNAPNQSRQYNRNVMPPQAYQSQYLQHQHHPNPHNINHQLQQPIYHQMQQQQQQQLPTMPYYVQPDTRRVDENVIRLPRGPDGPGFVMKR